jgi:hypothetical protein
MIQPVFQVTRSVLETLTKSRRVLGAKDTHDNGGINHCHYPAGFNGVQFLKVCSEFFEL